MNRQQFSRNFVLAGLIAVACSHERAAESGEGSFNLSHLAAPEVELPAIPDDGSGIYRLNLDQALGNAPLTVVLEVRQGEVF